MNTGARHFCRVRSYLSTALKYDHPKLRTEEGARGQATSLPRHRKSLNYLNSYAESAA
jgi:hypothetical protein